MKLRYIPLAVVILSLCACTPKKPWSPDDEQGLDMNELSSVETNTSVPVKTDIGDAEQGIWVEARIAKDSYAENVKVNEVNNRRDRLAIVNVDITPPVPKKLDAVYSVIVNRNFDEAPVVLRARIMVDGKSVGTIEGILGKDARSSHIVSTVDLFSAFDHIPKTFLATIEGKLFLMPEGTHENVIDPHNATSDTSSEALQCNPIRVTISGAGETESGATGDATDASATGATPAPAPDSAAGNTAEGSGSAGSADTSQP